MDAFEPVREAAAQLYAELVATGADASRPLALVEAAVRRLDLYLAWLEPGDPALKGARALYDQQTGTICCTNDGDDLERATLVAHEVGHACVHTSSSYCTAHDIDASRSTEAAPVGLQRVEDYGARERRELQANVFAREFLLPRSEARCLYLAEGLGAAIIAERRALPKDLVRQQLLDALLLPPAPPVAPSTVGPLQPDPSQDRAAAHRGSAFQLQAGPGTGKTRSLVKRVRSLLAEGIDPSAMLALTFSNRAASELSERIAAVAPEAAAQIWIGTFHAFGLDLIRRHHDRLGLGPDPALFDRSDAIDVLEDILPTLPLVHYRNLWDPALVLRDIVAAISRAKDELVDPIRYRALARAMLERAADTDTRAAAEKCLEVADVYDLYEKALRARAAVDFGDLVMRPALLLESDPALRTAIHLRHRHVLVDEYQDVNRASARLLRAVAGDGKRLWVVGDSRQSIYRFRGASSANMAAFSHDYPGAGVNQLSVNYRSSQEIVDALIGFTPRMGASQGMLPLTLTANRGSTGIVPEIRRLDTLDQEAEGVAASIRELEAIGISLRDQAVLCRTNNRLNEIAAVLEERGIPVLHLGSLFERDEVRDLLALMSLAVDPYGDGLARVGAMSRYDLPLQDVWQATSRLRETDGAALVKLAGVTSDASLSMSGSSGLARLTADLEGLAVNTSPWDFLATYLLDRTHLIASLAVSDTVADRMRGVAIWQFLNFIRDRSPTGAGLPIQRTLDRVRQLVLLAEERDLRQIPAGALHMDAVRLMTVHGSKGLEFEAVHVPGLTVSSFPSSNRGQRCPPPDGMIEGADVLSSVDEARRAHEQEEQCLFFVAASRSRTHLRLYLARRQPNGSNRSASPFLNGFAAREIIQPTMLPLPPTAPRPLPITITWPSDWHVTDSRLRSYEDCPRRFFYTHVFGLGSARKSSAFSRTHDCLYHLIRWLSIERLTGDPDEAAAAGEFERIWQTRGPIDHAFATDYLRLASRLVSALVRSGAGRRFRAAEPLAIDFANGRVVVEPDEIAELPNGSIVLRRIRTGRKRSDEYDRLEYSLYVLAGQRHFASGCSVEALHLTDESTEFVTVTPKKIANRQVKSDELLAGIASGWFPPEIDAVACPRCPHFFICAAAPKGKLDLELSGMAAQPRSTQ
jgi:DNA helicase II / ATP-dependent DNA helicase PcrA